MARPLRVLGLSLYGPQAASHRVRLSQFKPGLAAVGIDLEIQSLLANDYLERRLADKRASLRGLLNAYTNRLQTLRNADWYDLIIVHCELFPFVPGWLESRLLTRPFIYDFDDAFFLKYNVGNLRFFSPFLGGKFNRMISTASAVTAGNRYLATHSSRFNGNVCVLPSVVDTDHYRPAYANFSGEKPFTVGWIGSVSTAPYLQLVVKPLQQLGLCMPVRLLVIGGPPPLIPGVEVIPISWRLDEEVSLIHQFDVGIMPLPDTAWARGKCSYKLIQYLACGIPVVASAVGANFDSLPRRCGMLASTPAEWLEAFRLLEADHDMRYRLGVAGRQWVEQHYSLRNSLPILINVIRQVADTRCS